MPAEAPKPTEGKAPGPNGEEEAEEYFEKLSPEEEATLLAESNNHKTEANSLFTSGKYDAAINKYDEAVAVCPGSLDYELAVLQSNIAACHLKLSEWKEAVSHATTALNKLEKLEADEKAKRQKAEEDDTVEYEIMSAGAAKAAPAPPDHSKEEAEKAQKKLEGDIARIRAKALMRRARARSELGGWSNLEGALVDYKKLMEMSAILGPPDRKIVQTQLQTLPARVKAAQEKETNEMWTKLKDLGNGLLKPFGLSTDNFKMVKDEKTGGYSMNFEQGQAKK
ncbi:tetratricopeptide repeat protein 1 [Echria macrotheca]|uniref:Tetratricopeptide repeat protein 1 n=1 Tax=Echria macrotheca TaxID=438768 RepID=A0AAJ0BJR9_9PEZI|nr:tetratricopeptide repeat protein 1 [Echria macrotheca]